MVACPEVSVPCVARYSWLAFFAATDDRGRATRDWSWCLGFHGRIAPVSESLRPLLPSPRSRNPGASRFVLVGVGTHAGGPHVGACPHPSPGSDARSPCDWSVGLPERTLGRSSGSHDHSLGRSQPKRDSAHNRTVVGLRPWLGGCSGFRSRPSVIGTNLTPIGNFARTVATTANFVVRRLEEVGARSVRTFVGLRPLCVR